MWLLPVWYGTLLVCMMLAILISLCIEPSEYKSAAFMYGSVFNINVIVLLFAICLSKESEGGGKTSPESEQGQVGEEAPAGENQPAKEEPEPSANFVALDETSEEDPSIDADKWFPCCCSKLSYPCFFLLAIILSTIVAMTPRTSIAGETVIYFAGWESSLFLMTYGALMVASLFSCIKRGNCNCGIGCWFGPQSKQLLHANSRQISQKTTLIASSSLGLLCFTIAGFLYYGASKHANDINSFSEANSDAYQGESHVAGYALLDVDTDDDSDWCLSYFDFIPVNVTVAWGGAWGCPSTGTYCQAEVTTRVSCKFANLRSDDDESFEKGYIQEYGWETATEYVNFRYHNPPNGDDDAYDEYGFDYDPDTQPQYQSYWNRPSEYIYGDCSTCEARSNLWMLQEARFHSKKLHSASVLLGIGLVLVGWPLTTLFDRRGRVTSTQTQQDAEVI